MSKFKLPSFSSWRRCRKYQGQEAKSPEKANSQNLKTPATSQSTSVSSGSQTRQKVSTQQILSQQGHTSAEIRKEPVLEPSASTSSSSKETSTTQPEVTTDPKPDPPVLRAGLSGKTTNLIVSRRQRGNPILKHIRNVPWEFGDIIPDYQLGQTSCALFLSLRYHALHPTYVHERIKQLGYTYDLRVLLVQVDVKDPHHSLKELAKLCLFTDCTLILAWSAEEAGTYLETFKAFESKPPDLIMEKVDTNFYGRIVDVLTTVKKVNKTDGATLISNFETMERIVNVDEEELALCSGFGPQKAKRLLDVFHEPFLKSKKKKIDPNKSAKGDSGKQSTVEKR